MNIKWKAIPGYEEYYIISNFGDIIGDRYGRGCRFRKILKPYINKKGYLYIGLNKDSKRKIFFISRLVFITFIGKIPKGYHINHKDGDKFNNYFKNLECITNLENMRHAIKNGLFKNAPTKRRGIFNGNSVVSDKIVIKIRKENSEGNTSQKKLAEKYNISKSTLYQIIHRITWTHI